MIIGRCLARNARLYPDKPAIIVAGGGVTLTHRELHQRVHRLAAAMRARGIVRGSRMAIIARNCAEYLEVYFAAGLAGVELVPINLHLKPFDVAARLEHAGVRALITDAEFAPLLAQIGPALRGNVWCIGGGAGELAPYESLVSAGTLEAIEYGVQPEDTLYIGYTSGTTGPAKGARISQRAVVVGYLYKAVAYGLGASDITLNPGPFWHSAPRDYASLAIYLGGTSIVTRGFDAEAYFRLVEQHGVTNSFLVPTMLQMLTEVPGSERYDCGSLRVLLSGGSPLPAAVRDRVLERFGPVLHEFYGATETRMITTISAQEMARKPRSVGVAFADVEIRVLRESGDEAQVDEVGEVFIRGPGIFSGYLDDEARTRQSMRGDWFSLGDMGRLDDDGYLYLVDRKQDMIISGGENIYPNDIEEVLMSCAGVKEVAVIGVPDATWGELVTAVVVPTGGGTLDPEALVAACAARLPAYMKPRRVELRESLPRSPNGKILRRVLREPFWK